MEKAPVLSSICYYTEPVLAAERQFLRLIIPENIGGALFLHNSNIEKCPGYMSISSSEECSFTTNREAFLSGRAD